MTIIPILILICATAALGVALGVRYLRDAPRKPLLVGLHVLLGLGALEIAAYGLWSARQAGEASQLGVAAAGALAAAAFIGLLAPILGRRSRGTMTVALIAHAGVATIGLGFAVAWTVSR